MWKPTAAATTAFLALSLSNAAQASSSDALVAAIVGAGFGAAIGHSIDGRQGALLGSAIGAVAGTVLANNGADDRRDTRYGDGRRPGSYADTQFIYGNSQPIYTQPVYVPVYAQTVAYYPAQPIRVIYRDDDYRPQRWQHDRREWR